MWISDGDRYWWGEVGQTYADAFLRNRWAVCATEVGVRHGLDCGRLPELANRLRDFECSREKVTTGDYLVQKAGEFAKEMLSENCSQE